MKTIHRQKGQALITFLFFIIIAIAVTSAAVVAILLNSLGTTSVEGSDMALGVAEGGAEDALIRLIRDPSFLGSTFPVNGGIATTTVTNNSGTYTIVSKGAAGDYERLVTVIATYSLGKVSVTSWKSQ